MRLMYANMKAGMISRQNERSSKTVPKSRLQTNILADNERILSVGAARPLRRCARSRSPEAAASCARPSVELTRLGRQETSWTAVRLTAARPQGDSPGGA